MNEKAKIEKALIVMNSDLVGPDRPDPSVLMHRATSLARSSGCTIELFHVCYNRKLEHGLFHTEGQLETQRNRYTNEQAARVARFAASLEKESVRVSHETCWNRDRTEAILQKIEESSPDLVIKYSRDPGSGSGLSSQTDRDLVRRSPANVWLVNEEVEDIDNIVASVGARPFPASDVTISTDYDLLRAAGSIGVAFEADLYPVNAYQLPDTPGDEAELTTPTVVPITEQKDLREAIAKKNTGVIRALASYFDIPADNVRVREGRPDQVIPDVAEKLSADLVVIGAENLGRMESLVGQVTVEPVISRTDCDILIVREDTPPNIPKEDSQPSNDFPNFSLMRDRGAPVNPADAYPVREKKTA